VPSRRRRSVRRPDFPVEPRRVLVGAQHLRARPHSPTRSRPAFARGIARNDHGAWKRHRATRRARLDAPRARARRDRVAIALDLPGIDTDDESRARRLSRTV